MELETIIGLEIHAQLTTKTKIFSSTSNCYGAEPNTQACVIDLGMPGVLPVLNQETVRMAVMFGLAINAEIASRSVFARKNYFYPDLPKGYQISQYELPLVRDGQMIIELEDGSRKAIGITRAHLEEDAGKSLHEDFQGLSGIDLNRAGTPLLEIVSEPDLRSSKEAISYMRKIHQMVVYLAICDGNMQNGSFRCDANVSLRCAGDQRFGTRVEIKNLNSFRFVERAIEFEVERQTNILKSGSRVIQETRMYDAYKCETRSMRSKEEAEDYRYFPDPDLLPLLLDECFISAVRADLPELPDAKKQRFMTQYSLSSYDAGMLTSSCALGNYYETVVAELGGNPKLCANWLMGDFSAFLNKENREITDSPVTPYQIASLLRRVQDQTISGKIAKDVLEALWFGEGNVEADSIIEERGLRQIIDTSAIGEAIEIVIESNPEQLAQYRSGKGKLFGFFIGQVMKILSGKANPQQVNKLLEEKLKE